MPPDLTLPARRRRHARLIAALTTLIGACAEAAGAVYEPISAAPPGQEAVEVSLLPYVQVSLTAAPCWTRPAPRTMPGGQPLSPENGKNPSGRTPRGTP